MCIKITGTSFPVKPGSKLFGSNNAYYNMSLANKDILLKANASVTEGNNEGFLAYCTNDVVWEFVGDQKLSGKDAIAKYMKETYIEPPVFDIETVIEEGDYVSVVGKISLKDENKTETHYSYCDVWRFRDGKMAELRAFVIKIKPD